MPREIQHEDSLTFFSCLSKLVVQITVSATSDKRPQDDEFSSYIGSDRKRYGSGFVHSVDDEIIKQRCRRENCPYGAESVATPPDSSFFRSPDSCISSPGLSDTSFDLSGNSSRLSASSDLDRSISNMSTASTSSVTPIKRKKTKHYFHGGISIHTNKHIIYDLTEANAAIVKFFFDTPDGRDVVEGHVGAVIGVNTSQDHVNLHVMSHDRSLFDKIRLYITQAKESYRQMLASTLSMQQNLAMGQCSLSFSLSIFVRLYLSLSFTLSLSVSLPLSLSIYLYISYLSFLLYLYSFFLPSCLSL